MIQLIREKQGKAQDGEHRVTMEKLRQEKANNMFLEKEQQLKLLNVAKSHLEKVYKFLYETQMEPELLIFYLTRG